MQKERRTLIREKQKRKIVKQKGVAVVQMKENCYNECVI